MEFGDLKNKSQRELKDILGETRSALHGLQLKARAGHLKQVHKIAALKKIIARVSMLLNGQEKNK